MPLPDPAVSLMPVRSAELVVGKPLRETIYDWHGNVLLAAGYVLENQVQVDELIDNGFIKDSAWDLVPPAPRSSMPMAQSKKPVVAEPPKEENSAGKDVIVAMDDVRWYVGETLYLQLIDNSAVRYTVRMIGFVKNKTLIVTAPVTDGKFEFVRDGQTFIVRAFSGKKAYAFVTAAVKSVHSPHPYLHLAYPKEVRCTVVRKGVRAESKLSRPYRLGLRSGLARPSSRTSVWEVLLRRSSK